MENNAQVHNDFELNGNDLGAMFCYQSMTKMLPSLQFCWHYMKAHFEHIFRPYYAIQWASSKKIGSAQFSNFWQLNKTFKDIASKTAQNILKKLNWKLIEMGLKMKW